MFSKQVQKGKDTIKALVPQISKDTPFEAVLQGHVKRWEEELKAMEGKDRLQSKVAGAQEKQDHIKEVIQATKDYLADANRGDSNIPFIVLKDVLTEKAKVLDSGVTGTHINLQIALINERVAARDEVKKALMAIGPKAADLEKKASSSKLASDDDKETQRKKAAVVKEFEGKLKGIDLKTDKGMEAAEKLVTEYKDKVATYSKGSAITGGSTVGAFNSALMVFEKEKACHPLTKEQLEAGLKKVVAAEVKEEASTSRRPSLSQHGDDE